MNNVLIYQDTISRNRNSFFVEGLIPNGVKYFFQMEYTSFNIDNVMLKTPILNVTTMMVDQKLPINLET